MPAHKHDGPILRRVNAGVADVLIMKLCRWKTRAMFDGYNITDEDHLTAAVAKLNGKATAKSEGAVSNADALS